MAREALRLDASERRKRDGILQAADKPRGRARQPGGNLIAAAPIIVTALFGDPDFAWLDGLRRTHFPPERNQVPAHLTLFHQLPPSVVIELDSRLVAAVRGRGTLTAEVAGTINLGGGTALRVHSDELEEIRAELAEGFHGLLTPQDRAPFHPHVTIQNKVEPREARRLQEQLRATLEPRRIRISGLATWLYKGGPWEPVKRYAFRG